MRIGFYIGLNNTSNIDFTNVDKGNPGVGGTQYLEVLIATLLQNNYHDYKVIVYVTHEQIFKSGINQRIVTNKYDAIKEAYKDKIDVFIFTANNDLQEDYFMLIDRYGLTSIAWVHNYINYKVLDNLYNTKSIKRIIFVSQQQYDAYIDDKIIVKSSYIYNIVPPVSSFTRDNIIKEKIVTYVGALIKPKGFAILAKAWKEIVKDNPNAKLYVIGSGKLYNRFTELGEYGLADRKFERKFIKYLADESGSIMKSVKFLGTLGDEKEEIYKMTSVGVANPSGQTETFCLSAVEFEARGIPVVTYKGYGLLDTVKNGHTGLLSRNSKNISKHINFLLNNGSENIKMGVNGVGFSKANFSPAAVMPNWNITIKEVLKGEKPKIMFSYSNYLDDWKWAKYLNFRIKGIIKMNGIPSIAYLVSYIKEIIKKSIRL